MAKSGKLLSVLVLLALSACGSSSTATKSPTATESAQIVNGLTIGPNADLSGKDLSGADLSGADLRSANLSGADLTNANLTNAYLRRANLTGANLTGARLYEADLFDANLEGANLIGASLVSANLAGANLAGADLTGARLLSANLEGANLEGADLTKANLSNAILFYANLKGVIVNGADFTNVNFCGANVINVNFDGATLKGVTNFTGISSCVDNETTTVDNETTTNQIGPTWITKTSGDVFIAPFAQTVCDIMRTWQPPAETTSKQASLLEKANSNLLESILSNSESETYLNILVQSETMLEFGQKNPAASKYPISKNNLEFECDYYGFTSENSKFGA